MVPAEAQGRLEVYSESIVMHTYHDHGFATAALVSGDDIQEAFSQQQLCSGLLPPDMLGVNRNAEYRP